MIGVYGIPSPFLDGMTQLGAVCALGTMVVVVTGAGAVVATVAGGTGAFVITVIVTGTGGLFGGFVGAGAGGAVCCACSTTGRGKIVTSRCIPALQWLPISQAKRTVFPA